MSDKNLDKLVDELVDAKQNSERPSEPTKLDPKRVKTIVHLSPEGSAASALVRLIPGLDLASIAFELQETYLRDCKDQTERMLRTQAMVLNAIFTKYAGAAGTTTDGEAFDTYLQTAFRAQGLCHRTIRTLLEYKYPDRKTFIREQTNTLNQQFNAGVVPDPQEEKNINPENELLEQNDESRLDPETPAEASSGDSTLETVEAVNRPED